MASQPTKIDWGQILGPVSESISKDELRQLERATAVYPRRALRLSPRRQSSDLPFEVEPVPWFAAGHFVSDPSVRPGSFVHYSAGDYYIQDAGSMLALAVSGIQPGDRVCDVCASPGGKSTGALELLDGNGAILANEVIGSRQAVLGLALARSGYANHVSTNLDVDALGRLLPMSFDCVIVDAPCSGQSMIVRGKQSAAAYTSTQIEHSSARQKRILSAAANLVRPGGRLVYSTCTFSFAENELIIEHLKEQQPCWRSVRLPDLAAWESPGFEGCYRLWPHRDHAAGAFAAALIRDDGGLPTHENDPLVKDPHTSWSSTKKLRTKQSWEKLDGLPKQVDWVALPSDGRQAWYLAGRNLNYLHAECPPQWIELAMGGNPFAHKRGDRMEPSHGAIAVVDAEAACLSLELSDEHAIKYLAGESLRPVACPGTGWCLIHWRGRTLGWGKLAAGTLKNHLPKALRQPRLRVS